MSYVGNTPTTQAFSPAIDYFSGNGSTTAFTLSRPVASVAQVEVTVNNVPQNPGSAFTVSGQTLTFTGTPSSGTNNIYVQYTSPITQVIQPGQSTVNTLQLADSSVTTAKVADSAITTAKIAAGAVVQADLATNVGATGPAFSAYLNSAQTLSSSTWTKVQVNAEEWDTNNNFDSTTNYRFQPTVAGYYSLNAGLQVLSTQTTILVAAYKNGASNKGMQIVYGLQSGSYGSAVVYLNGSTDYVEFYAFIALGQGLVTGLGVTYFQGFLARAA